MIQFEKDSEKVFGLPKRLCKNYIECLSDFEKFKLFYLTKKEKLILFDLLFIA